MNSLKAVIVDDSMDNIETLEYLLNQAERNVDVLATGINMQEAESILKIPDIDIAFLDIQLKKGSIFEVLQKLKDSGGIHFESVFVTAHGSFEFALKAIRYACLDFITKPVDQQDLDRVLSKALLKKKSQLPTPTDQFDFVFRFLKSQNDLPSSIGVILPKGIIEFVQLNQILYFKADGKTCKIFCLEKKVMTSTRHLGYYIELLQDDKRFIQISKNHMINNKHLKQYYHKTRLLTLMDGSSLNASVRFSKGLKQKLLDSQASKSLLSGLRRFFD